MKKFFFAFIVLFFTNFVFSQTSITDAIKAFDEDLMNAKSTTAQVSVGFITYDETNTCGTIVRFLIDEIKSAVNESERIVIVETKEFDEYEQAGIATRGYGKGMNADARKISDNKYNLDGKYYDKSDWIELELKMYNPNNNIVLSKHSVRINKTFILEKNLTLYPTNKKLVEEIQNDFENAENELEKSSKTKILLSASMMNSNDILVNYLQPKDKVRFKIWTNTDCYLAFLNIDANGKKCWLPINNNFLRAGKDNARVFPDISPFYYTALDDVFGAEKVIIYACTNKEGLPNQNDCGKYSNQDLHMIMKKQVMERKNKKYKTGVFNITYTILEN